MSRRLHRIALPARVLLGLAAFAVVSALWVAPSGAATAPSAHRIEAQILTRVNHVRATAGCRPLKRNAALARAAQKHSVRMARARTMSHQLPGEAALAGRAQRAGYRHWTRIGENVAVGYRSAKAVMRAWMHSPGHRANILDCHYRDLGVGVTRSGGKLWFTQDFGRH